MRKSAEQLLKRQSRRAPRPVFGVGYERQTFACRKCRHEMERNADSQGKPHD